MNLLYKTLFLQVCFCGREVVFFIPVFTFLPTLGAVSAVAFLTEKEAHYVIE